jgi:hypothetical protein
MTKPTLIAFLLLCSSALYSQQDFFVFKKRNKTIASFRKDYYIAFQLKNRDWHTGFITKIQNDSFFIKSMVVRYSLTGLMGSDTVYYPVQPFALTDVYAMPKRGVQVDYIDGRFQITTEGGHQHWYWIKSGWLFRVGGAGYAGLNVINGLIKNDLSLSGSKLGIAAGLFAGGVLLKHTYKLTLRLKKKYHLQFIKISDQSDNKTGTDISQILFFDF